MLAWALLTSQRGRDVFEVFRKRLFEAAKGRRPARNLKLLKTPRYSINLLLNESESGTLPTIEITMSWHFSSLWAEGWATLIYAICNLFHLPLWWGSIAEWGEWARMPLSSS